MDRLTKYSNDIIRNRALNILRELDTKNKFTGDDLGIISAFCIIERSENKTLKEYEDINLSPEQIKAMDEMYLKKCQEVNSLTERLKRYETLEKLGRLMVRPCEVGDTAYCDGKYFAPHCAGKIHSFKVSDIVTEIRGYFRGEIDYSFDFADFGKTVFLTREDAEKALEGYQEC